MFVDEANIDVVAGRGGDGHVAFRKEKFVPRGGPSGGDGGRGGDVVFVATHNAHTLSEFRFKREIKAENGEKGGAKNKTGANGEHVTFYLPIGTIVVDRDTNEVIADLSEAGQRIVIARGGHGGLGNQNFATPTNRTPRRSTPGKPGQEFRLHLELKLIADIGLIGFPSVGKSTLIAAISSARPKIADYPFTTLVPNLGVVQYKNFQEFVVADIPGLIEGAHEGLGLGVQFLKHVERTNMLVHLLEVTPWNEGEENPRNPIDDFEIIQRELGRYNTELLEQPQLVVLNKVDLPYVREQLEPLRAHFEDKLGMQFLGISAATGENIDVLKDLMGRAASEGQFGTEDKREAWER